MARVPVQNRAAVVECSRLSHEDFATAALFGRATIKTHRAFEFASFDLFCDRDRRRCRSRTKEMMTASVPAPLITVASFTIRNRFLLQAGQRVVFTQHADHWFAGASRCGERGRNSADVPRQLETGRFQH